MEFLESYKHLEKLCGEIMQDGRTISAYIDAMKNCNGSRYVQGWDDDLKKLKHYHWVRNQIAHEPNCTEENMCDENDIAWLDRFHERIMTQTDPLALYRKERMAQEAARRRAAASLQNARISASAQTPPPAKPKKHTAVKVAAIATATVAAALIILFLKIAVPFFLTNR